MLSSNQLYTLFFLQIVSCFLIEGRAQEITKLDPVTRTYAITNATITQAPGKQLLQSTILIKDGLILSVGKNSTLPPDAIVIKGDSLYVYAGFIDGLSYAGVTKPSDAGSQEKPKDPGNPTPDRAGIKTHVDVHTMLNPSEKSLHELRSAGFTVAHVVPHGVFLPGKGAIISLGGKSVDALVLADQATLFSELSWYQGAYPSTVMGVMAKWRELYIQANQNKSYETQYASNTTGLERPVINRVLQAFYPVIEKKIPVFFKAEKAVEIQRVLTLQRELGFHLMLGEVKEGWMLIDKFKSSNTKVFLSLDIPEDEKDKKKESKDEKKEMSEKEKKESEKKDISKEYEVISKEEWEALQLRKSESIANYVQQAALFNKAGMKFGFSTMNIKPRDIQPSLRRMIAAGLSEDAALAALTTYPAALLGLSDRMGTLDKGKIANLIVTDKPYFSEKSRVRYVFIDGHLYECEKKDKKKQKDEKNTPVDIEGPWSFAAQTPQGKADLKIVFRKENDQYKGSISGGQLPEIINFKSVELDGNKLRFMYDATVASNTVEITVEGIVEGNVFKGNMTVGQYGTYPFDGTKDPKKF